MSASRWPKRDSTQSRRTKRDAKNAKVAPRVEANDTSSKPHHKPNTAPPAKVMMTAPGKDKAVATT